jgi:type VII secretion-associated serine protease mycosin
VACLAAVCPGNPAWADSIRERSWQLEFLHVSEAQRLSVGQDVTVAVLDSGVNGNQPELMGTVLPGTDATVGFTGDGTNDRQGHGTGIAALIAGHGHGSGGQDGVLGLAPAAKILPVTVLGGGTSASLVGSGIQWAVGHGAKVICLAIGVADGPALDQALDAAFAADVVVVASMGNRPGDAEPTYPAAYPGVVAVTGVDDKGEIASLSVTGAPASLSAPATNVPTPGLRGQYGLANGTSVSTALVAGVVALVRAKYPQLSAKEVIHRLEATADDKGAPGRDDEYGYGIVDPVKALTADVPPLTPSASPTPQPSATAHAEQDGHRANPGVWVLGGVVVLVLLAAGGVVAVKIRR